MTRAWRGVAVVLKIDFFFIVKKKKIFLKTKHRYSRNIFFSAGGV